MSDFRVNLKEAMLIADIRADELAYLTGIRKNTINNYLKTNGTIPNLENASKICKALGVSYEFLISGFEKSLGPDENLIIQFAKKYSKLIQLLEKLPEDILISVESAVETLSKKYKKQNLNY